LLFSEFINLYQQRYSAPSVRKQVVHDSALSISTYILYVINLKCCIAIVIMTPEESFSGWFLFAINTTIDLDMFVEILRGVESHSEPVRLRTCSAGV